MARMLQVRNLPDEVHASNAQILADFHARMRAQGVKPLTREQILRARDDSRAERAAEMDAWYSDGG